MSRIGPLLSPLLIGRDEILELAARRVDEAAQRRGQFLLVAGEAGIGKTRLLGAIGRFAEDRGFRVSDGALAPQDRDVPVAIFLDLARTMSRQPAFGDLGSRLLDLVSGMIDAERPQRRLLVQRTVDLLAGEDSGPTMLVFEDLQWADEASLEILAELARQTRGSPLLLAGAYRSDEAVAGSVLRDWRSRLVTQRLVEEARLSRLSLDETGLMTTLIMATGLPAPRPVVAAVFARTDGVPLYVEELLGAMGPEALGDSRAIREAAVPDSLEDAIVLRIRRLSPDAQEVARAGAVIGRSFVPEVLAGVMDLPVEAIDGSIQELIDNGILDGPGLRGLYDYRHQLLRDALYRSISVSDRRRLHARAAEFGAALEGASEIHASVHYERAGMREQAFRAAIAGARSAARVASHREATELYRRATDNMPDDLPLAERADILLAYSDEASFIEDGALSEHLARDAREAYLAAGDGVGGARAHLNVIVVWRWEGHPLRERLALIQQTIDELEGNPESPRREVARQTAYSHLAWARIDGVELDRARDAIGTAAAIVDAEGRSADGIDPDVWLGTLDVLEGSTHRGLAKLDTAAANARALGDVDTCISAYRDVALLALRSMEYGEAAGRMDDSRRYADRLELTHCGRVLTAADALLAWAIGDWDEAKRTGDQSLADHDHGRAGAIARWAIAYVDLGRGLTASAAAHLDAALAFGERADWLEMTLPARWGIAENALLAGDVEASVRESEIALAAAVERGEHDLLVPFVVTGVRSNVAAGRPEAAEGWLTRISEAIGPASTVAPPALDHGRGLLRLAAGSLNAARDAFEAAIAGWDQRGRRWEALWARLDLAATLVRSNRHVDAARLVMEVESAARQLGSAPLLSRAEQLGRLASRRGTDLEAWHPLSVREFEVARQIAAGQTNAEIAGELFVSPKTVSAHVEHILAKLGVARRAEIAAWVAMVSRPESAARAPVEVPAIHR